jgi:hypothetical protein
MMAAILPPPKFLRQTFTCLLALLPLCATKRQAVSPRFHRAMERFSADERFQWSGAEQPSFAVVEPLEHLFLGHPGGCSSGCMLHQPTQGGNWKILRAKIEGRKVVWCSCLVFENMRVNVGKWADRIWNPRNTPVDAVLLTYLMSQLTQHSFFVALKSPLLLSIKCLTWSSASWRRTGIRWLLLQWSL